MTNCGRQPSACSKRHGGQEYEPANAAVTSMVNHVTTLQQRSDCFENNASLRNAAINEPIAYFRDGEQVRGLPAQRTWQNLWSKQRAWRPPGDRC
jgi:hypothetical protein